MQRLDPYTEGPEAIRAMLALEEHVQNSGLERPLIHLVKTRASIVNGCSYCLHMHTREARRDGESETRLHMLGAWQESSLFTARERAALAWTDALTRLADTHAPDEAWAAASGAFSSAELVELTLLIGAINVWNRIAVGFRSEHPAG